MSSANFSRIRLLVLLWFPPRNMIWNTNDITSLGHELCQLQPDSPTDALMVSSEEYDLEDMTTLIEQSYGDKSFQRCFERWNPGFVLEVSDNTLFFSGRRGAEPGHENCQSSQDLASCDWPTFQRSATSSSPTTLYTLTPVPTTTSFYGTSDITAKPVTELPSTGHERCQVWPDLAPGAGSISTPTLATATFSTSLACHSASQPVLHNDYFERFSDCDAHELDKLNGVWVAWSRRTVAKLHCRGNPPPLIIRNLWARINTFRFTSMSPTN
jgi:hypothetical protein